MKRRDKIFAFVKLRIGLINVRDFIGKLKIVIATLSASVFRPSFCWRALSAGGCRWAHTDGKLNDIFFIAKLNCGERRTWKIWKLCWIFYIKIPWIWNTHILHRVHVTREIDLKHSSSQKISKNTLEMHGVLGVFSYTCTLSMQAIHGNTHVFPENSMKKENEVVDRTGGSM